MASGSKKGRGLGGGALLGIFFVLALLMGAVFTLGYLLGRGQYDPQLRATVTDIAGEAAAAVRPKPVPAPTPAATSAKPGAAIRHSRRDRSALTQPANDPSAPVAGNWDFYHAVEPAKATEPLGPQTQGDSGTNAPAATSTPPAKSKTQAAPAKKSLNPPIIPRGAIILQVAALQHESDALAMAQMLRQKKFPAFVLSPDTDKFYRVQVGPYANAKTADAARQKLEAAGFKSITKK